MKKTCSRCEKSKSLDLFRPDSRYSMGVHGQCRKCEVERDRERYFATPKSRRQELQRIDRKKYAAKKKAYYEANKERILKNMKKRQKLNYAKCLRYWRKYWRMEVNKKRRYERFKKRLKTDTHFRFVFNARAYVRTCLRNRNIKKIDKFINLLGCSIEYFQTHIQKQFKLGMAWENYGYYGWHIDHILPCDSFDLKKESEQRKCFHYTNLRPLWARENFLKGAKIITPTLCLVESHQPVHNNQHSSESLERPFECLAKNSDNSNVPS